MRLVATPGMFAVCQLTLDDALRAAARCATPYFLAVTSDEASLVCLAEDVPSTVSAIEGGWALLRVVGELDFGLVGVIADISELLADAGIPIFVVSTYLTDYVMVKANRLSGAVDALVTGGHTVDAVAQ